jgi:hypothetical protein
MVTVVRMAYSRLYNGVEWQLAEKVFFFPSNTGAPAATSGGGVRRWRRGRAGRTLDPLGHCVRYAALRRCALGASSRQSQERAGR